MTTSRPAIEALAKEIAQARQEGSQTVPERQPVGESQSNGIIERAAGLVAGHARTLKAALDHRMGTRVPPDARTLCGLVEYAAYLMNRCDIGSDGKTRASGEDHVGGDVVMREDDNNGGHPSSEGPESRRRITTKREPREVRDERPSTNEQHVPRRMLGKTTPRCLLAR